MIFNLFTYTSNFGKANIYKCDYYGNQLSMSRQCLIDNFTVNVEEKNTDDVLTFGSPNQSRSFFLGNRKIKITADFLFLNDLSGTLNPAIDLLFNLSCYTYQGTNAPFKFTMTGSTVNEQLAYNYLISQNYILKYYLVSESSSQLISGLPNAIPSGYWVEIFIYGQNTPYPLIYEPMFRLDTAEGSFYSCLINKVTINMNDEFVKLSCEIDAINYDRSTRYNFINSTQQKIVFPAIKALHKSRIKIQNYVNDITSNFNLVNLNYLEYMNSLTTQSFDAVPIKEFSITIDNNLKPYYSNKYGNIKRSYVSGYYSAERKISGTMKVFALRSNQPTFDRFPVLSGVSGKSCSVLFGNQIFTIPYTVWVPGKIEAQQNNYVEMSFNWEAIARNRAGEPEFNMIGELI